MEERTGWQGQNKTQIVGEEKWQTCWRTRDQRQSRLCQKEKEQSRQSRVLDCGVGEKEIRARAWKGRGGPHSEERQIPRRGVRATKKSLTRRCRRKHDRVSGRKSFPGRSAESSLHSMSGQT